MLDLLDQIILRSAHGESLALCTVVRTRGSTPQSAGAAMLVLSNGKTMGTLGGGCVEAEVRHRALALMSRPQCRLLSFRLDHDFGWDDDLVCGGIMDVAVQIIADAAAAAPLQKIRDQLRQNQPATLALAAIDEQGNPAAFQLIVERTPNLLIAGGGHVGHALAALARNLDFAVTVIDDRADVLADRRFPGATCVVGEIDRELKQAHIDDQTYVVIVTRGHKHDAAALAAVINSPARYIGLIGSKRKVRTILDELYRQGIARERLQAVHSPIGLEIGAVSPSEIAVSIAAELIAVRRGRGGQPAPPMKIPTDLLNKFLDRETLGDPAED